MTDELAALLSQAETLCSDAQNRTLVQTTCPYLPAKLSKPLDLRIHPNDQMLRHSLNVHRDANAAFSQYYNVALQQYTAVQQILRGLFPDRSDQIHLLDFACGYGRLLRLLSHSLPRQHIWAAEIQTDALAYVTATFGVQGIASHGDPEDFKPDRKFHMIWVASLFSHLPDRLFKAWIQRLTDCLEPNGVLCFSVHDVCLLPEEHQLPATGILFFPSSENTDLDTSIYGTTFVNEAYVARSLNEARGAEQGYYRLERALAHEQDIYVVPANPKRDLSALDTFRRGPWGWTDDRELRNSGELYLRGWAASIDDGALSSVTIEVDGQRFDCPTGKQRDDVAKAFEDPRLATSGWEFRYHPPKGQGPIRISVIAQTPRGESALLFAALLDRPQHLVTTPNLWTRLKTKIGI